MWVPAFRKKALRSLFQNNQRFCHFFILNEDKLWEIRGASIHSTLDIKRKESPAGYFFAARLWDEDYINELARITRTKIKLVFSPKESIAASKATTARGLITFFRKLPSWDNQAAAYLQVEITSPFILALAGILKGDFFTFIIFFGFIFVVITLAIFRWVSHPLRLITRALNKNDAAHLEPLKDNKDEFGVLSRILTRFLSEKDGLQYEINERKKIESMLRESERRYRLLAENTKDIIWTTDLKLNFTYISPSCKEILGYLPEELINQPAGKILSPTSIIEAGRVLKEELLREILPQKDLGRFRRIELEHIRKDGSSVFCELIVTFLRDEKGKATGILGVTRDITERRRMEEELRESERSLRQAQKLAHLGSWKYVPSENKTIWSEEMFHIYGLTPKDEAPSFEVLKEMVYEEDRQNWLKMLDAARHSGRFHNFEYRIVRPDGQIRWLLAEQSIQPKTDDSPRIIYGTVLDITERKRYEEELLAAHNRLKSLQEQLIQAEKLEAVGRLAAGVAHEVKNPLGIILQAVNYLEEKSALGNQEILKMIKDNIRRADNIISSLVDFSRATKLTLAAENINAILENSVKLIQPRVRLENIEIIRQFQDKLPFVLVDRIKMEQVFVNILVNAVEAMPEGGKIYLRTYKKRLDKPSLRIGDEKEDYFRINEDAVVVEIEDTGKGIAESELKEIFEPFFTTKCPDHGTGLGLAVSKNIIDLHKGLIEVKSKVGQGTCVIITLKIADTPSHTS
ncbi:MAG: PAS domain S-box protein [Candidatus Omnitrophica bacterium]|nr:PAS domain S-box protein [Candidatus Omnitrophota bacterium]